MARLWRDTGRWHVTVCYSILRLVKRVFVDTSVLLHWCYDIVLQIPEYFPPVWWSAARTPGAFDENASVTLLDYACCTRFIRIRIIVCFVRCPLFLPEFDLSEQLFHHELEFEVWNIPICKMFSLAQVRMWNDHLCTLFDTGILNGFKGPCFP